MVYTWINQDIYQFIVTSYSIFSSVVYNLKVHGSFLVTVCLHLSTIAFAQNMKKDHYKQFVHLFAWISSFFSVLYFRSLQVLLEEFIFMQMKYS